MAKPQVRFPLVLLLVAFSASMLFFHHAAAMGIAARVINPPDDVLISPSTTTKDRRDDGNDESVCSADKTFVPCPASAVSSHLKQHLDAGCTPDWDAVFGGGDCASLVSTPEEDLPECEGPFAECLCGANSDPRLLESFAAFACRNCTCPGSAAAPKLLEARRRRKKQNSSSNYKSSAATTHLFGADVGRHVGVLGVYAVTLGLYLVTFAAFWEVLL